MSLKPRIPTASALGVCQEKAISVGVCLVWTAIAVCSPIKSLLTSDFSILREETDSLYIAEGLVAWWDSEWNAGYGECDYSEDNTSWKDLVGGYDFYWTPSSDSTVIWSEGALKLVATRTGNSFRVSEIDIPLSNNTTVEIVAKMEWRGSNDYWTYQLPITWYGTTVPGWRFQGNSGWSAPGLSIATFLNNKLFAFTGSSEKLGDNIYSCSVIGPITEIKALLRVNDRVESLTRNGSYDSSFVPGRVRLARTPSADIYLYSIRFYNRALSQEEQFHNFVVDKERFGIK